MTRTSILLKSLLALFVAILAFGVWFAFSGNTAHALSCIQPGTAAEELEKVLVEKYGILIGGENLWKVLGFQSAGSFQRAATRKLIPLKIFPIDTSERRKCFELLRAAYIDARYNKNYAISKKQLEYLIKRVEKLKETTEKICLEKINL